MPEQSQVSLKRYLVFAGESYYPLGGWDDLIGQYDTIEEARMATKSYQHSQLWAQIIDIVTQKDIESKW